MTGGPLGDAFTPCAQGVEMLRPRSLRLSEEAVQAAVTNPANRIGSWVLEPRGLGLAALMARTSEAMRWLALGRVAAHCRPACTNPMANPARRTSTSSVLSRN
jgi:hypothetical protein